MDVFLEGQIIMMLFAEETILTLNWANLLIQTGALGLLCLLIWLLPKVLKDTLKEINDSNRDTQKLQHENAKLEREGFAERTRLMVDQLKAFGDKYPMLAAKVDQLIEEIKEQTDILRKWPSDPEKVCRAHLILERCETLIALIEKKKSPPR